MLSRWVHVADSKVLDSLLPQHKAALLWFHENEGTTQPWPRPMADGTFLASKAKGIYKPQWTDYALSIRQTLNGPYPDEDPVRSVDAGKWSYRYFQEGSEPATRDDHATNRGLMACLRDQVPVGVMRQIAKKPTVRYNILGLANVVDWKDGYFRLEEFQPDASQANVSTAGAMRRAVGTAALVDPGEFNVANLEDLRQRTAAQIVRRRGQLQFRRKLLDLYGGRCAISGCDAPDALEAAHIVGYLGPATNHPANGLLLRADLHTLFDLGLISIAADYTVLVSPSLMNTSYAEYANKSLLMPLEPEFHPSLEALAQHRGWAGI